MDRVFKVTLCVSRFDAEEQKKPENQKFVAGQLTRPLITNIYSPYSDPNFVWHYNDPNYFWCYEDNSKGDPKRFTAFIILAQEFYEINHLNISEISEPQVSSDGCYERTFTMHSDWRIFRPAGLIFVKTLTRRDDGVITAAIVAEYSMDPEEMTKYIDIFCNQKNITVTSRSDIHHSIAARRICIVTYKMVDGTDPCNSFDLPDGMDWVISVNNPPKPVDQSVQDDDRIKATTSTSYLDYLWSIIKQILRPLQR